MVVSESAVFNSLSNRVDFTVTFNATPDFYTVDGFNRANAFQYHIFYDNDPFQPPNAEYMNALIRGDEIHVDGDLRIRDAGPPAVGDPNYGGWGSIRATTMFNLSGATMSFSFDLGEIGDNDGQFAYQLNTYDYGVQRWPTWYGGTAGPYPTDSTVPEPASIALFGIGALGLMFICRKRRQIAT